MEFTEVIKNRYSCKKYDSAKVISEEKLNAIDEWNDLKEQVTKLNGEYEAERQKTMALIRKQIMTKKTISK